MAYAGSPLLATKSSAFANHTRALGGTNPETRVERIYSPDQLSQADVSEVRHRALHTKIEDLVPLDIDISWESCRTLA
jgi:hypothetical protein